MPIPFDSNVLLFVLACLGFPATIVLVFLHTQYNPGSSNMAGMAGTTFLNISYLLLCLAFVNSYWFQYQTGLTLLKFQGLAGASAIIICLAIWPKKTWISLKHTAIMSFIGLPLLLFAIVLSLVFSRS